MPYFDIALAIAGAAFFARGAQVDRESPLLWGALSAGASLLAILSGGGLLPWLCGQVLVYLLIFAWRMVKERKREGDRG
jgi:hypothetical protein